MPIGHYVEPDQWLIVCRLFGGITENQIFDMLAAVGRKTSLPGIWRSLLVFDDGLDMSSLGVVDLERIRARHEMMYRQPGVSRGMGAAVVPGGDGGVILPFYNALCGASEELKAGFRTFAEIPPALDWLGIDRDEGMGLVARAADSAAA